MPLWKSKQRLATWLGYTELVIFPRQLSGVLEQLCCGGPGHSLRRSLQICWLQVFSLGVQYRKIVSYWGPRCPRISRHGLHIFLRLILPCLVPFSCSSYLGVYCACWPQCQRGGFSWACVVYSLQDTCEWANPGPGGIFWAITQCTKESWIPGALYPLAPYWGFPFYLIRGGVRLSREGFLS